MRKLCLYLIVLSALLLSACSQTTAVPSAPTGAANTSTPKEVATVASQPTGPTMECQVVSLSPTQGPTEASMFPPVSSEDWVLGNTTDPDLTLIEYSDFQ